MADFAVGDRVYWSHNFSTMHGAGSVVTADAAVAFGTPDDKFGTIVAVANDEGTYFEVKFEDDSENMVLTNDELVKVVGGDPVAAPAE